MNILVIHMAHEIMSTAISQKGKHNGKLIMREWVEHSGRSCLRSGE